MKKYLFLFVILFLDIISAALAEESSGIIGAWGGEHINVTIKDVQTLLELDCASGRIDKPFIISPDGSFNLSGEFIKEGGPVRIETENKSPVQYFGKIQGDVMEVNIKFLNSQEISQSYKLFKNQSSHMLKCL